MGRPRPPAAQEPVTRRLNRRSACAKAAIFKRADHVQGAASPTASKGNGPIASKARAREAICRIFRQPSPEEKRIRVSSARILYAAFMLIFRQRGVAGAGFFLLGRWNYQAKAEPRQAGVAAARIDGQRPPLK